MPSVVIESGPNAVNGELFYTVDEGLFKKYGVNASWLNVNSGSAQDIATVIAGAAQFSVSGAANEVSAAQAGGPIRAILIPSVGGPQQIELTQSFANAHNIPTQGNTEKQALAQLQALKGTHAVIANTSLTSNSYVWMLAAFHKYGLSYGAGCSSCDINLTFVGTVPNEVTAFNANKVDGIGNTPPTTSQAGGVVVQFAKVPPLTSTLPNFIITTTQMVQSHPDTVQAVTNAFMYGMMIWRPAHEAKAEADIEQALVGNGNTQPVAVAATQIQIQYLRNPYPTVYDYNTSIGAFDISVSTPYNIPYSQFVVPRFAQAAEKLLHLSLSQSPRIKIPPT